MYFCNADIILCQWISSRNDEYHFANKSKQKTELEDTEQIYNEYSLLYFWVTDVLTLIERQI